MSKIMNRTSYFLLLLVLAVSAIIFNLNFQQMGETLLMAIIAIVLTYCSIWLVYYLSRLLLRWLNRQTVKHATALLNMILSVSLIGFGLYFSSFFINWNVNLLTLLSDLVTALAYFYFANQIEKASPGVATGYALIFVVFQTVLTWI